MCGVWVGKAGGGLSTIGRHGLGMPNYIRPKVSGATVFFTVALADRRSSMLVERIDDLRESVRVTRPSGRSASRRGSFCRTISIACGGCRRGTRISPGGWVLIKARFSRACGRAGFTPPEPVGWENGGVNPALRRKGEVGLWQPRFWEHHIRDEDDYRAHVRYCWINPVKHGFVARPEAWRYVGMLLYAGIGGMDAGL
jgi:putative transposase